MYRCSKCGNPKTRAQMETVKNRKPLWCKECRAGYQRSYRRKYPGKVRQWRRDYRNRHPDRVRETQLRYRQGYTRQRKSSPRRRANIQEWKQRNRHKGRDYLQRHRARKAGAEILEHVDRQAIIERDNSTCYLWCKRKLKPEEITLDHVVPLSRGGRELNLRPSMPPSAECEAPVASGRCMRVHSTGSSTARRPPSCRNHRDAHPTGRC